MISCKFFIHAKRVNWESIKEVLDREGGLLVYFNVLSPAGIDMFSSFFLLTSAFVRPVYSIVLTTTVALTVDGRLEIFLI